MKVAFKLDDDGFHFRSLMTSTRPKSALPRFCQGIGLVTRTMRICSCVHLNCKYPANRNPRVKRLEPNQLTLVGVQATCI
jgi:hypothetical protein